MPENEGFQFTTELDWDLMDQVVYVNPWSPNKSWEDVAKAAREAQPIFMPLSTKTLMARTNLLLAKQFDHSDGADVTVKASGIVGNMVTFLLRAIDEAILLKAEAEQEAQMEELSVRDPEPLK